MSASNPNRSIVIIVNTLFYPARRNGMSVRYFPLVKGLAGKCYAVDVVIFNKYREQYSQQDIQGLRQHCRDVEIINPPADAAGLWRRVRNVAHLLAPFGKPYELIDNLRDYYFSQLRKLLASRERYDAGIGVGVDGNNAELLLMLPEEIRPQRILCDFIDSANLLKKRARISGKRFVDWLGLLEEWKTRRWEQGICRRCRCVYISKKDAQSTGTLAQVIPNSIVEDGFEEATPVALEHPNIAFLGNMAYPPNAEAGAWLCQDLFPRLKKALPELHCYIIGRNPGEDLQLSGGEQDIHITGEVDNIWDYVRSVDVFVFPLFSGAGMQNKVLEAMYAGKPVVCTSIANEGIGAIDGKHLYLADDVGGFLAAVRAALADNGRTGRQAEGFVRASFSTASMVDRYIDLLEG